MNEPGMYKNTVKAFNTVIGIIAHVDAGKTTLSEAILYKAGVLRKSGRVDDRDTLFDSAELEKERGITIFSSRAPFKYKDRSFTLLDTPGHIDFSAETERTLGVLDACILVISGLEGVESHTRTLWSLLALYRLPVIVFITKMDYAKKTREELLSNLNHEFSDNFVDFSCPQEDIPARNEAIAFSDDETLSEYDKTGTVSDNTIKKLVKERKVFPCYFGSGLKNIGIESLLEGLYLYSPVKMYPDSFGACIYKITHDENSKPLLHMKITGGELKTRDFIGEGENKEKVNRIYCQTGDKKIPVESAFPGEIVTVSGPLKFRNGDSLGIENEKLKNVLEPLMRFSVILSRDDDSLKVLPLLKTLEEEEPTLKFTWNPCLNEIQVSLMGLVQAEILKSIIYERFSLNVEIGKGSVLYKETICKPVEGAGHFEPLRHYAEVHLLIEPLKRNEGLVFDSKVPSDKLKTNWQRLIMTHLAEKEHLGVLTGSPLTDVRITLVAGKDHIKHTEGGDFRQATYRAVRNGLMFSESILLEPFFRFRLEIPSSSLNRATEDIKKFGSNFLTPSFLSDRVVLSGRAPVIEMNDYASKVASYTGGTGYLRLDYDGYDVCHNPEEVIKRINYDPEADLSNTPDSVFCTHGAGYTVKWSEAPKHMHLPYLYNGNNIAPENSKKTSEQRTVSLEELEEIMLKEFGPIKRPVYTERKVIIGNEKEPEPFVFKDKALPEMLIIDGYNVIFAWKELRELAAGDIHAAREKLITILSNYAGFKKIKTVLVFDGYLVPFNPGEKKMSQDILVVYTKEKESADLYIEKLLDENEKKYRMKTVTSDGMIQLFALRKGVTRISSNEFEEEVARTHYSIKKILDDSQKNAFSTIESKVKTALTGENIPDKK